MQLLPPALLLDEWILSTPPMDPLFHALSTPVKACDLASPLPHLPTSPILFSTLNPIDLHFAMLTDTDTVDISVLPYENEHSYICGNDRRHEHDGTLNPGHSLRHEHTQCHDPSPFYEKICNPEQSHIELFIENKWQNQEQGQNEIQNQNILDNCMNNRNYETCYNQNSIESITVAASMATTATPASLSINRLQNPPIFRFPPSLPPSSPSSPLHKPDTFIYPIATSSYLVQWHPHSQAQFRQPYLIRDAYVLESPSRFLPPRQDIHKLPLSNVRLHLESSSSQHFRPTKTPKLAASSTPSKYCHSCGRPRGRRNIAASAPSNLAMCGRIGAGCRKVVCATCIVKHGWQGGAAALITNNTDIPVADVDVSWLCPHCRGGCGDFAQCATYGRTNIRRHLALQEKRRGLGWSSR
jgi:hypothetical protein